MTRPHTGPLDFSELAHGLVKRMVGEDAAEESPHAAAGRKGGKARAKKLTAAERAAIAQQGAGRDRQPLVSVDF